MTEVTYNHEATCDFCGRDFPAADVKTNDQGQAVCKTCLDDGITKICAECGSFQYSENMHFVVGLHVEVCDECWYGPYSSPVGNTCTGCKCGEGGCRCHLGECGRHTQGVFNNGKNYIKKE